MGGTFQDARSNTASVVLGSMRGTLSTRPPPVMWAMPWIRAPDSRTASTGLRKLPWTASRTSSNVRFVPGTRSLSDIFSCSKAILRASE